MRVQEQCHLLGGFFSTFIQGVLGTICITALIIKRQNEVPKRDWYVWFLDFMKQGIGSSFGHFSNIFLSVLIAESLPDADECQWYCLTYVIDSTIGTMINLLFLHLFGRILQYFPDCTTMHFGEYGAPPQLSIWFPQLLVWLSFVLIGKLTILFFLFQFIDILNRIISLIFKIFHDKPQLELVIVMIVIPTILNTIQFWVTDTFLKSNSNNTINNRSSSISNNSALLIPDYDLGEDLISEHDNDELFSYELQQIHSIDQSKNIFSRNRIIRQSTTKYTAIKHSQEVEMIENDIINEKNVDIITDNNNSNNNTMDGSDRDRTNINTSNLFIKVHNPIQNNHISFKSNKNI